MQHYKNAILASNMSALQQLANNPKTKDALFAHDAQDQNLLFFVCRNSQESFAMDAVNFLLSRGLSIEERDSIHRQNILYWTAATGKANLLQFVLSRGKFDLKTELDVYKQSPMFYSCRGGSMKCTEILLEGGTPINHRDLNGQTCLFWAACSGSIQICRLLLLKGCKYGVKDNNGEMAIDYAKSRKHPKLVDFLRSFSQLISEPIAPRQQLHEPIYKPARPPSPESYSAGPAGHKIPKQKEKEKKKKKPISTHGNSHSSAQIERKPHVLVYTDDDGQTRQFVTRGQIEQLFVKRSPQNLEVYSMMKTPELIDNRHAYEKGQFKIMNKIINQLFKVKGKALREVE